MRTHDQQIRVDKRNEIIPLSWRAGIRRLLSLFGMTRLYRTMKVGENGEPKCGSSGTELGVRIGLDIALDHDDGPIADPETGAVAERLVELKRVGGWDFAFSAPKSVSLALAFGDQALRGEVLAAHRAAVAAALELLEREAIRVRVGSGGLTRHQTHGLLAVVIEHAWARQVSEDASPDPQLHTHVVVANMAKRSQDEAPLWRTLDMQPVLREWKLAVGSIYQAVLRYEVTARLGWDWTEPRNGLAELKAWPTPCCGRRGSRPCAR